ncbi:MAG: hypothetical protein JWO87_2430 [Phycisphaerales bacterium]|nr:hypothetical protein [Phycisphaerales bacterium]
MYVKIVLTLLLAVSAFIAVRLAIPPRAAPVAVPAPGAAEAALEADIDSLEFNATPAEEAVKVIEQKTGIHVVVDWDGLANRYAVSRQAPVIASLRKVKVADALHVILLPHDLDAPLASVSVGDTITISAAEDVPGYQVSVRVYDVRDLLTDDYWGMKSPESEAAAMQNDRLRALVPLVSTYVHGDRQDIRTGNGPVQDFPVTAFAGKLIVKQTTGGHRRVEQLLAWLRRMH